jgi:alpha-tubulin suppressor-like RCC1 family protein
MVDTGENHTCVATIAGAVKCWGSNFDGELGTGSTERIIPQPRDVTGLGSGATMVAVGTHHTCALMDTGGVKC